MADQGKAARVATLTLVAAVALGGCAHRLMKRSDLVTEPTACTDTGFAIYFDEGSDQLTRPARQLIDTTARSLRNCSVTAVEVVGLADAAGSSGANFELSQRRARTVMAALSEAQLPAPTFSVGAGGEMGAMTEGGHEVPVRRRAEVMLRVAPPP